MRYQERIYIQNQFGVRNKVVPNVNMSSDYCVFSEPKYILSGATKIGCETCSCPSGFTLNNDTCVKLVYTSATFNGLGSIIVSGDTNTNYGQSGANFFPNIQNNPNLPVRYLGSGLGLKDSLGNTIAPTTTVTGTPFWGDSTISGGRLNKVGLSATTGQYVGFSKCINIEEAGTYYIGLAADNFGKFKVNGKLIVFFDNLAHDNFKFWSVFEINLLAGINIIEVEGRNQSSATAFGAEIYKPASLAALTASTNTSMTGLIFSTKNKIGSRYDLGDTIGYSCPSGYSLNLCTGLINCVKINKEPCVVTIGMSVGEHIITGQTSIPLLFNFTGNTESFITNNAVFKYEVYKYNPTLGMFVNPPIHKSGIITYSSFSNTNILEQSLSVDMLAPDGEYLVKGFYEFPACTEFLNRLAQRVDTLQFKSGTKYQLYEPTKDYYFTIISKPSIPMFLNGIDVPELTPSPLFQEIIFIDEGISTNIFEVKGTFIGDLIITLNGSVLAQGEDMDYTYTGNTVMTTGLVSDKDVITAIYNRTGGVNIIADTINVSSIASGVTGTQGTHRIFFNTTTSKYEIYLERMPVIDSNIIVNINTTMLSNNLDYYQSISNIKRIILEGDILIDDIITMIYYPQAVVSNRVVAANSTIVWRVDQAPTLQNGRFILEVSPNTSFSGITYSAMTPYEVNVSTYSLMLTISGSVGTKRYYRVKSQKDFTSICGDNIQNVSYSEVIPITVSSNSINSY